jgi:hypothetical protein
LQNLFKEALNVCLYALKRFSRDDKNRYIPSDLHCYTENLELALSNSEEAINMLQQKAAEWLNVSDLQCRENS